MSDQLPPNESPEQIQRVYVRSHLNTIYVHSEEIPKDFNELLARTNPTGYKHFPRTGKYYAELLPRETGPLAKSLGKIYVAFFLARHSISRHTSGGPLDGHRLMRLTDWVPSAVVRKRQKRLIADEIAEINEFRAKGRMWVAWWRRGWLVVHWTRYLLGAPIAAVVRIAKKTSAG